MDIAGDAGILLAGYANGAVALWDLVGYNLIKYVPNLHETEITNIKIFSVLNNGSSVQACSSEEKGGILYFEINKKALFGGYSVNSEFLFKSKIIGSTAISVFKSNSLYPHKFC